MNSGEGGSHMEILTSKDAALVLQREFITHYPESAAAVIESFEISEIIDLIDQLPLNEMIPILKEFSNDTLIVLFESLNLAIVKDIIACFTMDKISQILSGLEKSKKTALLAVLPKQIKSEVLEIQKYPESTAGSIMDPDLIRFYNNMTVQEAINKIKTRQKTGIRFLFIVDEKGCLTSMLTIQQLILAEPTERLVNIASPILAYISDITTQEEVVDIFEKYRVTDIPVVDINHKFVGVLRNRSLIKAAKAETSKDIQTMVGVSEEERALSKVAFAVRKRLPWLEINLLTAFLAASVVGFFESTIAKYTALAVLLPVVAGQSGNTGAQALAVTIRGLALKEVRSTQWLRLLIKELRISMITGLAVALTTALGVLVWSGSIGLSLIIGFSMVVSMILAGISGAAVPLILTKLGQDPASSSSIILTTITDVCGFFSFLGIATLLSTLI